MSPSQCLPSFSVLCCPDVCSENSYCTVSVENKLALTEESCVLDLPQYRPSCQGSSVCPGFLPSPLSRLTPCTLMRGQSWWSYHTQLAVIKTPLRCSCCLSVLDSVLDHACLISYREPSGEAQGLVGGTGKDLHLNFSLMPGLALWSSSL